MMTVNSFLSEWCLRPFHNAFNFSVVQCIDLQLSLDWLKRMYLMKSINQIKIHLAISITILPKIGFWYFGLNAFLNLTKKWIVVFLAKYIFYSNPLRKQYIYTSIQSSWVSKFVNTPFKGIFEKQILWIRSHICESYCQNINFDTILIPYFKVSEAGLRDFFWGERCLLRALFFHACKVSGHVPVWTNSTVPPKDFEAHATFTSVS